MMNFGGPELLLILAFFAVGIGLPIYAAVEAFRVGANGWGIGVLIAMFVPFGFILAIVYLAQRRTSSI